MRSVCTAALAPLALSLALGASACATSQAVERRGDGTLRAECRFALHDCLQRLVADDWNCSRWGYDVVYAIERRHQLGNVDVPDVKVTSEAIVRCRQAVPAFGADPNQPAPPAAGSPPRAPAATGAPRCVPGASAACSTPAGCTGAQVCAPDGASFGPCECAPAPSGLPAPPTPPQ
jgi:hypothetical protein